jgi:hypothetical protein
MQMQSTASYQGKRPREDSLINSGPPTKQGRSFPASSFRDSSGGRPPYAPKDSNRSHVRPCRMCPTSTPAEQRVHLERDCAHFLCPGCGRKPQDHASIFKCPSLAAPLERKDGAGAVVFKDSGREPCINFQFSACSNDRCKYAHQCTLCGSAGCRAKSCKERR